MNIVTGQGLIGTEHFPDHYEAQYGHIRLITVRTRLVAMRAPLLLTADDGRGGVHPLPQGGLLTGRTVGGPVCACGGRMYQLLEGFPWGKRGDLFRRNQDRVARAWVASCPGLTLTEPETAKAPQVYPLLRLHR